MTHNHYKFPAQIEETRPNVYRISFMPRGKGTYKIWVNYAGTVVKGKGVYKIWVNYAGTVVKCKCVVQNVVNYAGTVLKVKGTYKIWVNYA